MSPSPTPRHASEAVLGFLELYPASVTTPILAWLAAAPLRSQASTFPYLAISGEYGTGKSAFLEKYIPAITGFSRTLGLGADPTLYAMTSLMAAGNAFPVMLDEFRTNHSKRNAETLAAVSNVIRASWNAGVRETGGHPLDPKRKIRSAMSSPLIVAGEIEQDEGSTRERMVPVYLVKAEQGDEGRIMDALVDPSSFAPMYLDFLLHSPIDGEAAHLREVYGGPAHLDNRMRITLGYLEQGWALLQDFMAAIGRPIDAVDLDLSAVLGAFEETKAEPPLSVALMEVMGSTHGMNPAVWEEDEVVYVKMGQFAKEAEGLGYIVGPPKTVSKSLDTLFQAGSARITVDGRKVRVRTIPAEKLSGTMEA
jgi:hypothetical protein